MPRGGGGGGSRGGTSINIVNNFTVAAASSGGRMDAQRTAQVLASHVEAELQRRLERTG